MTRITAIARGKKIICVAGRLFDLHEKLKSEELERAVLAGAKGAADELGLTIPADATFVPYRDAGQETMEEGDKTRVLFELDEGRLARTALLVAFIDGLSKDEGVCFEIGYAWARGSAILLVSTDFFEMVLPNQHRVPVDPLIARAATTLVRRPRLQKATGQFQDDLERTRDALFKEVCTAVKELALEDVGQPPPFGSTWQKGHHTLVDFGGFVFEWQERLFMELQDRLGKAVANVTRTQRYENRAWTAEEAAAYDLDAVGRAGLLVTGTDGDEAPSGTAFLQGAMRALGRPVWMYNSKRTKLVGPGGYESSRNLMLDHSASRVFRSIESLAGAIREMYLKGSHGEDQADRN